MGEGHPRNARRRGATPGSSARVIRGVLFDIPGREIAAVGTRRAVADAERHFQVHDLRAQCLAHHRVLEVEPLATGDDRMAVDPGVRVRRAYRALAVSYTHLRAHETPEH